MVAANEEHRLDIVLCFDQAQDAHLYATLLAATYARWATTAVGAGSKSYAATILNAAAAEAKPGVSDSSSGAGLP